MARTTLAIVAALAAVRGAAAGCGVPDASHPPALRMSGDRITGVTQGIVGGTAAAEHSYPWMVMLWSQAHGKCGGALVSDQWVLTSAKCLFAKSSKNPIGSVRSLAAHELEAWLGQHKINDGTKYKVRYAVAHPSYSQWANGNDIALVQLETRVKFTDKVQPICLPSSGDSWKNDGEKVVMAGFGKRQNTGWWGDTKQMDHAVLTTALRNCNKQYWWDKVKITGKDMCAEAAGKASCCGDEGSPIMARRSGRFVAAGVVSRQNGCSPQYPNVETHVPDYVDWVKRTARI